MFDLCRVQPPDAENRMSGGVEGTRGEIPVSPSDHVSALMKFACRTAGANVPKATSYHSTDNFLERTINWFSSRLSDEKEREK